MSWSSLEPVSGGGNLSRTNAMAVASISTGSSRLGTVRGFGWRLNLMIYADRLVPAPPWLIEGARCAVDIGHGEYEGIIRLRAGGFFTLHRANRGQSRVLRLVLPMPPLFQEIRREPASVVVAWTNEGLDVAIPAGWRIITATATGTATGTATASATVTPSAILPAAGSSLLDPRILSNPAWASPKARAEHEAALAEAVRQ